MRPHRLVVRTPPFHGGNRGSSPRGDANILCAYFVGFGYRSAQFAQCASFLKVFSSR